MEEELQKLYEKYSTAGYNLNKAYRMTAVDGYDSPEAMAIMESLYQGGDKKKSQDASPSGSSSEEVSMESTSATAQTQAQEAGGSDFITDYDSLLDDILPGSLNIPDTEFSGLPNTYREGTPYKINPRTLLNNESDPELDRILSSMQSETFNKFVMASAAPVQALSDQSRDTYKDLLPGGLLEGILDSEEPLMKRYGNVLNRLATAYVLDKRTAEKVEAGMDIEQALLENKQWMSQAVDFSEQDFEKRGSNPYKLGMKKNLFDREFRKVLDEIEDKQRELEVEYLNDYFGKELLGSLPSDYNETFEDAEGKTQFTDSARTKLASVEKQLRKRTGYGLDLSGDNVVGNRPLLKVRVKSNGYRPTLSFEGELPDKLEYASMNVANGIIYGLSKTVHFSAYEEREGEEFRQEIEASLRRNENEMEALNEKMNQYQLGISQSLAKGDFSSAFNQSLLMTAEGAPYLLPMVGQARLGIVGTAAASTLLGTSVEASMIRNDKTFDTFVKDGKEYSYYEAAEIAGTYDVEELEKSFEIKPDPIAKNGYLASVALGEFGVNLAFTRALSSAYKKGAELELKNYFKGYMQGQRIAVGETAASVGASVFIRKIGEAQAKGGTVDFDAVAQESIDTILGTLPMTMLLHTSGSVARNIKGTSRSFELVPLDTDELITLHNQVNEYSRRIGGSRDPRFISEANQFINNARKKIATLQQSHEDYLTFLHKEKPELALEVSNMVLTLDRLKLNHKNTNDPNLKMQIKEQASALLQRLDEVYGQNKVEFEQFQGVVRGVREREEKRQEEGRTREMDQRVVDELTSPQQRTDEGLVEKPVGDPTLSPYAKRNDRINTTRRLLQRVKDGFNKMFRSSGGMGNKNLEEVVRSQERLQSAWLDELEFDAKLLRKLMKNTKRDASGARIGKAERQVTKEAINDFLRGKIDADDPILSKNVSKADIEQYTYFRDHIDSLSEALIQTIESQPAGSPESLKARQQLIEKIRNNKGVYLTQSYEIFMDGGKRLNFLLGDNKPASIQKVYNDAVEYLASKLDNDVTSDVPMSEGDRRSRATQMLNDYLMGLKKGKNGQTFGILGSIDSSILRAKNNEMPEAIQNLLGKITDPSNAYLATSAKLNSYLANTRWQNELAIALKESGIGKVGENFRGQPSEDGMMVSLFPDSPEWMPLHQQYVPEQFKKAFENLMPLESLNSSTDALGTIYNGLIKVTSAVKVGKTVFAPTTTARNLVSGVFLGMANGHLPLMKDVSTTLDAVTMAWGASSGRALKGKGKFPDQVWRAERKKLIEMGILKDGANSQELMRALNDTMTGDLQRISGDGNVVRESAKRTAEAAQKLYAFGDDFFKVNGYYQERQAFIDSGMSIADAEAKAAERVRGGYPTYSYISKGAKEIRRFPLLGSFVSFPYEMYRTTSNNIRYITEDLQAGRNDMAMRRAGGLLASSVTAYAISEYSMDKLGLTDEDDEAVRSLGPEWQKLSQLVYLGEQDGSPVFMDASFALPMETVVKPLRALMGGDPNSENFAQDAKSALLEASGPFRSVDLTFNFIKQIGSGKDENGRAIFNLTPDQAQRGPLGIAESILDFEHPNRGQDNAMRLFAHFAKTVAPGVVGNVIEFTRAGAAEELYEAVSGEKLPNGHPLEELQDAFQDYFPKESRYKNYTVRDAALALLGMRVSYLPINVAASQKINDWTSYASKNSTDQWLDVVAQPEITMGEEIDEKVAGHIGYFDESNEKIQAIVNLTQTLGLNEEKIVQILKDGGVSENEAFYYANNKIPPLGFISDDKIDAYVKRRQGLNMDEDQLRLWYETAFKNTSEYNRTLAEAYIQEMVSKGYKESEIEEMLNERRDELGRTNWSEKD